MRPPAESDDVPLSSNKESPLGRPPQSPQAVICKDASVVFPNDVRALRDVNLSIPQGARIALVGPSGCGKTTLLRVIAGLQTLSAGECQRMEVKERDKGQYDRRRCATSFVFQQPALLPWATVQRNVELPLKLGRRGADDDLANGQQRVRDVLMEVQLDDAMNRFPHQLSGGMKMRASIARALVTNPDLLLLDEPFAALDDLLRNQLGRLVTKLWRSHRFTSVLVTHNIAEAIQLCERIVVMHRGRLVTQLQNPLREKMESSDVRRSPEFADFYGMISDTLEAAAKSDDSGDPS